MNELEEKVYELVGASPRGMTQKQLEHALGGTSSAGFVLLSKALENLEEDCYVVRDRTNHYVTAENAGYVVGKISVSRKGVGYVDREGADTIVLSSASLGEAMDGDTVVVKPDKRGDSGEVIAVRKHAHTYVTGTFREHGSRLKCVPDDEKIQAMRYSISVPKDLKTVSGLRVLLKIDSYGALLKMSVAKVIGHKDDPGVDILSILLENGIDPEFPQAAADEAESFEQSISEEECIGRTDLRGVLTITIDGDDSKDFDDAVSISADETGWNLKVSIADVSHYVREGSALDAEAFVRGTSTYAVNTVVPMLPHLLSNGICSLNPEQDRLAITCDMQVSREGRIRHYDLYPSVIRSDYRMTYRNVNKILAGDPETRRTYENLIGFLEELTACADAIRSQRHERGAVDFDVTESEIRVNEQGFPVYVGPAERGHGERVIEDCMIAANVCVADLMKKNDFPCIYRVHGEPDIKKLARFRNTSKLLGENLTLPVKGTPRPKDLQRYLEEIRNDEAYPILAGLLLRCMQKAVYDNQCLGHYGIAEARYLHFTSPIRRYPDLVVHRMLRRYYFNKNNDPKQLKKDQRFTAEAAQQSSERERAATEAERSADDMKKAEYMMKEVGNTFTGTISSVTSFGFYVELPNTVEGLVSMQALQDDYYEFDPDRMCLRGGRSGRVYKLGQTVDVIVDAADKESHTVDFRLPERKQETRERSRQFATRSRSAKAADRGGRKAVKRGRRKK